jgi:ribosomal protein S18 acetylase RimI-like enzyme
MVRSDSLTLERANTADLSACTRLLSHHYGTEVSADQEHCLLQLLDDPRCAVYMGRLDAEVVALAVVNRRLSLSFEGVIWAIEVLHVEDNYRRIGVGTLVLQHLLQEAHRGVCRAVVLEVPPDNLAARSLLRSLGFTHTGRLVHWRKTN